MSYMEIELEELQCELSNTISREEVLIAVLHTLRGSDADDIEKDLRQIREERSDLVHRIGVIKSKLRQDNN